MNLTSPSQVKAWCIERGFHPNKTLGQNFLVDANTLEAILDIAAVREGMRVLEIGPGLGVLTQGLLARGANVTAIEKDSALAARLAEELRHPNLSLIAADALDEIKKGTCDGYDALVSNLPYQAGTRILLDLVLRPGARPETMTVLMQTEVCERLAAMPGDGKKRGLAGVLAQLDYDVECVREVPPSCFWPKPEVGSTVAKLVRHHRNDNVPAAVRETFRALAIRAFEHRRKQMGSIFKGVMHSTLRPEQLTNEEWLALAAGLTEK